jgi:hypothetical protein
MRHVIGIGLALGLSAAVFFAGGWAYLRLLRIPVIGGSTATLPAHGAGLLHDGNTLWYLGALGAIGLVAGIFIAVRQVSPLAAGLPGLGLIAWTVWYAVSVREAVRLIPLRHETFGAGFEAMLMNGVLGAAGLALIVPLFIPSRWRPPRPPWAGPVVPAEEPSAGLALFTDDLTDTLPYPEASPDPHWN